MFRFYLPQVPDPEERIRLLNEQFDAFLHSDALQELFALLHTDADHFRTEYNGRSVSGGVRETQELTPMERLEPLRHQLYPLLYELGFFHINQPLRTGADHILILGGSLNACHLRTDAGKKWITEKTRSVDGLTCFRPIHPVERTRSAVASQSDTEFGAMTEAFCKSFDFDPATCSDDFAGDRNLNRISCVRTLPSYEGCVCRIFAAPSSQPDQRRADTGDTLLYYLQKASPDPGSSLLAVTHNRYCNRQFLQLAWYLLKHDADHHNAVASLDVVGLFSDDNIPTAEQYDPYQLLQDLIGILDWIDRFSQTV